jgi:hypothetical protein
MAERWIVDRLKRSIVAFRKERVEAGLTDPVETDKVIRFLLLETPLKSKLGMRHPCIDIRGSGCTEEEIDQAFAELAQEAKKPMEEDSGGMSTQAKVLLAGLTIGGALLLMRPKRKGLAKALGRPPATHEKWAISYADDIDALLDTTRSLISEKNCKHAYEHLLGARDAMERLNREVVGMGHEREGRHVTRLHRLDQRWENMKKRFDHKCRVIVRGKRPRAKRS